ncbi:hypothetical protein FXO38_04037 [Capsicum annuum]|nr:hypothetical protein FXO38_04037 [Capsicum annuum]
MCIFKQREIENGEVKQIRLRICELFEKQKEEKKKMEVNADDSDKNQQRNSQHNQDTVKGNTKNQHWLRIKNKYRRDKYGHILGEVEENKHKEVEVSNLFGVLEEQVDKVIHNSEGIQADKINDKADKDKLSTKEWVNETFSKSTKEINDGQQSIEKHQTIEITHNKEEQKKELLIEAVQKDNTDVINQQKCNQETTGYK